MRDRNTNPRGAARTAAIVLSLALLGGVLVACGGGSAEPGEPGTRTIIVFPNAPGVGDDDGDGFCSYRRLDRSSDYFAIGDGEISPGLGDVVGNHPFYGFLYFPLSEVPAGATIVGARLHLRAQTGIGTPFVDLGRLQLVRIAAATPIDRDAIIAAAALTHDPTTDITSGSADGAEVVAGQLANVQAAHAAGEDLFIRLGFPVPSDGDTDFDTVHYASSRHATIDGPRLEIVIEE